MTIKIQNHLENLICKVVNPKDLLILSKVYKNFYDCKEKTFRESFKELLDKKKTNVSDLTNKENIKKVSTKSIYSSMSNLQDSIEKKISPFNINKSIIKEIEKTQNNKLSKLNKSIEELLKIKTEGKKVSSQLRVSEIADKVGCSSTHLINYIRANLSKQYTLIKGRDMPKEVLADNVTIKSKPFYIVSTKLLKKIYE